MRNYSTGWFQQEQQETVWISPIRHGRAARIGDSSSAANRVEGQDPSPIGDMMPGWGVVTPRARHRVNTSDMGYEHVFRVRCIQSLRRTQICLLYICFVQCRSSRHTSVTWWQHPSPDYACQMHVDDDADGTPCDAQPMTHNPADVVVWRLPHIGTAPAFF